ncbi:MAG TPA: ABC transporter ATP-binding protein [Halanaerobiales bacterium]|nr:ABC transporter ATP-binding protein [Halanaerobiales bacterium]
MMNKMQSVLDIKGLSKIFTQGSILSREKITAVDDVFFKIKSSEIFTLAGESGCGKTTVARMILGFEEPSAGKIIYRGNEAKNEEKVWFTQGIQAIFQNPFETFNPLRKVDRYLFETIHNYKLAEDNKGARELIKDKLKAVGLDFEDVFGKYPSEFSGGQLQRISIARALLTDPSLLIADEPVSMVDASIRMSIVNLFKKLKDELDMSVLYITHDLATAYYMSGQIAIMFRGQIMEMGPVEKVLMDSKHPYTKLLRESIPEADPDRKWQGKISISEIEYEEYLRTGCKFAGRCPEVMDKCKEQEPAAVNIDDVVVKCHLFCND